MNTALYFKFLDKNFDKVVTPDEFRSLNKSYKISITDEELDALFRRIDTENNGSFTID